MLGIDNVRSWTTMMILAQIGGKPRELFITALVRARFCQLAGEDEDGPALRAVRAGPVLRDRRPHRQADGQRREVAPVPAGDARRAHRPHRPGPAARLRGGDGGGRVPPRAPAGPERIRSTTSRRSPGPTRRRATCSTAITPPCDLNSAPTRQNTAPNERAEPVHREHPRRVPGPRRRLGVAGRRRGHPGPCSGHRGHRRGPARRHGQCPRCVCGERAQHRDRGGGPARGGRPRQRPARRGGAGART